MREKQENWENQEKSQNESREFLEEEEEEEEEKPKTTRRTRAPPRDRGNFVRLNLKRKSYSRASMRGKFLRKQVWKQKWRKKFGGGADVCFRCGGKGHWASECRGKDLGSDPPQQNPLLSLDEIAQNPNADLSPEIPDGSSPENSQLPLDSMDFSELEFSPPPPLDPLYPLNPDGTVPDPPEEVLQALRILGFDSIENPIENPYPPEEVLQALRILGFVSFRPGQAEAVMRILCGLSTLLLLPTGSVNPSVTNSLPSSTTAAPRCISIVVSPLISLMDDQVCSLPSALTGVCIHSNLTPAQREAAIKKVRSGQAQLLLLSPESITASGFFSRLFPLISPQVRSGQAQLLLLSPESITGAARPSSCCFPQNPSRVPDLFPPFPTFPSCGFACLDEADCVSRWAHNFRPAYLRVCKVLRQRWGVRCLLGLTATAGAASVRELGRELGVPAGPPSVGAFGIPPNLRLSVAVETDPDQNVRGKSWNCKESDELLIFAGQREAMQVCAVYHAGLSAERRRRTLRAFMAGRVWALCGTACIGLGMDRAPPEAVLQHGGPACTEAFLQHVGRAGRDGKPAWGHLILHKGVREYRKNG
ncbi:ATP-dependent DNA helicase Q4-like [Zonotrichia albicollis]|uniref:ATP-dependent DNA helicase Q4-like n=1 Tax=Zonotrichia albicollis TaxID=44394 RepID=UPI003D8120B4